VPFSDPMADGPVIQRASERAMRNRVSARDCLALVKKVRAISEVPIVLFSYLNPLLSLQNLGAELSQAGVDGVLAIDLVSDVKRICTFEEWKQRHARENARIVADALARLRR